MIVNLAPENFSNVLALYRLSEFRFPLISAVIEGRQRGQVFVDQETTNPRAALVVSNFGFMFLFGLTNPDFDASLDDVFKTGQRIKPSYLLWYAPPAHWREKLSSVRVRERIRFVFRGDRNEYLNELTATEPGFELRKLDSELLPKTKKFSLDIDSRFWSSAADVEKHGLGVCLVKDDEIVSLCYAAAVSDGLAEVDVVTDEAFRGLGLANIVSRAFIRECLVRDITPTWDCFAYNTGSLRLAAKLGFCELVRYPFYSFNVPLQ